MAKKRIFGEITGISEGAVFNNRKLLKAAGIHNETEAGIAGSKFIGSESIVVSGGYEDDEDFGSEIIYTGSGGRKKGEQIQTFDQVLNLKNLALARSCDEGYPVRVTRGYQAKSKYSPKTGYQYAGIYYVDDYWSEKGKSGFTIWRYRLVKERSIVNKGIEEKAFEYNVEQPKRIETTTQRIVRNTKVSKEVKAIYGYKCQVCGELMQTASGLYAEGAHVQALGEPHNGPDTLENILCLCSNHHVLFDKGGISINDDFTINDLSGRHGGMKLIIDDKKHVINLEYIRYHRKLR